MLYLHTMKNCDADFCCTGGINFCYVDLNL